jgi:hypothetical protein
MPRKEFVAFTRLDASDVNTFLMDQSVMTFAGTAARGSAIAEPVEGQVTYLTDIDSLSVYNGTQWVTNRPVMTFAGTAARGSAIPSPVEGMTTYLEDIDDIRTYNGTSWISPHGMTLVNSTTFTSQTTINIDNIFSADYDYYKFYLTFTGTSTDTVFASLRAGGSTISLTNYNSQRFILRGTSFFNLLQGSRPSWSLGDAGNGISVFTEGVIATPFQAARTHLINHMVSTSANTSMENYHSMYSLNTSATGLALSCANAITGKINIYGLRN